MINLFNKKNQFKKMKNCLHRHFPLCSADIRCGSEKGLVSIVLPVYNGEKYLESSINSVLSQTYTNLELIVIDDGSTDLSGEIADSFLKVDPRVSVIHQKNMKLPKALNNGFASASGEFFTWTSADNIMHPSCLEILCLELSRDREADMVFGNMELIDEKGDTLKGYGWYEFPPLSANVILPDSTEKLNLVANNTIGAAFLYRAGANAVLKGYSEYKFLLEDYDYFMRMNSLLKIKHILYKKPIYKYRFHTESLTSKDEELGITKTRPKLMELDGFRREFYQKPLYFYADGVCEKLLKILKKQEKQIKNPEELKNLSSKRPANVFYINFGNVAPTVEIPKNVPRFLVDNKADSSAFGYDVNICLNSAEKNKDFVYPATFEAAASFISLRARNDIMYNYEKKHI